MYEEILNKYPPKVHARPRCQGAEWASSLACARVCACYVCLALLGVTDRIRVGCQARVITRSLVLCSRVTFTRTGHRERLRGLRRAWYRRLRQLPGILASPVKPA